MRRATTSALDQTTRPRAIIRCAGALLRRAQWQKKTKKSSKRNLTASQRVKFSAQSVREIAPLLQNERKKIINEAMRASLANQALTLHPHIANRVARLVGPINHHDAPIRKAFAEFGLDPEVPHHWRILLGYLAEAHFAASLTEKSISANQGRI
jgi:hypothetical protein